MAKSNKRQKTSGSQSSKDWFRNAVRLTTKYGPDIASHLLNVDPKYLMELASGAKSVFDSVRDQFSNLPTYKPNSSKALGPRDRGVHKRTTGHLRKFRKPRRKVKKDLGMLYGSVRKHETGGTLENVVHCGYIGHTTNMRKMEHETIWESIFRQMARNLGLELERHDEPILMSSTVFYYRASDDAQDGLQGIITDAAGGGNATPQPGNFETFARVTADRLYAVLQQYPDFYIEKIELRIENFGPRMATLRPSKTTVKVKKMSRLRLQNQTFASRSTQVNDAANALDIENNPLVGKVYAAKHGGFLPTDRPASAATEWKGFVPNAYGLIGPMDSNGTVLVNNEPQSTFPLETKRQLDKPPHASFFRFATKTGNVKIDPGIIKVSTLFETQTMSLHKWFMQNRRLVNQYGSELAQNVDDRTFMYNGKARLYSLEKALDSRTGDSSAKIAIGWQLENRVSTAIFYRTKQILPERVADTLDTVGTGPSTIQ